MGLEAYQSALEEVLTWLLSAEDGLQSQPPISACVEEVKEQFHTHEVEQIDGLFCLHISIFSHKKFTLHLNQRPNKTQRYVTLPVPSIQSKKLQYFGIV